MRAVVTLAPNEMSLSSVDEPVLGPSDVIVRPELVGLCGSDIHFFSGHLDITPKGPSLYPRIQGHEFSGTVQSVGDEAAGCPLDQASVATCLAVAL